MWEKQCATVKLIQVYQNGRPFCWFCNKSLVFIFFYFFVIGSSSNTANRKSNQSSSKVTVPYAVTAMHFNLISSNKASDLGMLISLVKFIIKTFNLNKIFDYIPVIIFNKFIRITKYKKGNQRFFQTIWRGGHEQMQIV